MKPDWAEFIRTAIISAATEANLKNLSPAHVRLPGRRCAAAIYRGEDGVPVSGDFPPGRCFGVPLIAETTQENGWLLLTFTDAFYSAAADEAILRLPAPESDLGSLAINRMYALSKKAHRGCPADARVQRALLLLMTIGRGVSVSDAGRAALTMFSGVPPRERARLESCSGAVGDAGMRLLYSAILPERNDA